MVEGEHTSRQSTPVRLKIWARWISAAVGAGGGVAGGWSVFSNDNQAGSLGLLTLAGLFILMAISGRVPDRIGKDGIEHLPTVDEEASLLTVQELLTQPGFKELVAEVHLENVAEVEDQRASQEFAARRSAPRSESYASHVAKALAFERNVRRVIETEFTVQETREAGFDFIVQDDTGARTVGVEIKVGSGSVPRTLDIVKIWMERGKVQRAVVVVNVGQNSLSLRDRAYFAHAGSPGICVVTVNAGAEGLLLEPSESARILNAVRQSFR